MISPKWDPAQEVDAYFFIHDRPHLRREELQMEPVWEVGGIGLSSVEERARNVTYEPSTGVRNNGSVYLHAFFAHRGWSICCGGDPDFDADKLFWAKTQLNAYMPKPKEVTAFNLLSSSPGDENGQSEASGEGGEAPEGGNATEIVSFWKPAVTVAMVQEFGSYPKSRVLPHHKEHMVVDEDGQHYYPLVFFNEFWLLRDKLVQINDSVEALQLELTLAPMTPWMFQLFFQMDQSFSMQKQMGLSQETDSDDFKRILIEGNPILLGVTFVVTLLHTVFDFLAFKNDIGFWKDNKSMEGLSARTVVINCVCQAVIFLYLLDNETSYVVILSSGVGMLIEFWKITKAMKVELLWREGLGGLRVPWLKFSDRDTYTTSQTKQYDEEATRYLSYALYPLVAGYTIYSLIYEKHKSWYSWLLSSFVGAVYTFGFILMCPQLYLNYKLKSVAHLPWRQLTYKFLNTIIDDLFAFAIKMPLLHRLSVFRDDVVFLVFLYQWWLYGVDKTRANEFGFSTEKPAEPAGEIADGVDATGGGEGQLDQGGAQLRRRRQGEGAEAQEATGDSMAEAAEPAGKKEQ
ncbi:unnamed protein product [Ostreobium quekettii]|uniref:Uncharacterized protein n=1 Tax=Ostreobium quekettii TaxID=121088 RepID=A0A8S1JE34_9CHLO|nr:unnamed protein product [Ostreobium quekettii]|eukprot:evm.model.scf_1704.3 EVM.evm.TU.scf_1704.3   scf_1704:15846-17735(-)